MKHIVEFKWDTFPTSEKYQIFRVWEDVIWQIISPKAYYIDDNLEWDYFYLDFIDPITADIICEILNDEERRLNGL